MDNILNEFKNSAFLSGHTYLFNASVTLKILRKCQSLNKNILGIDGFIVNGVSVQPVQEDSIDYTRSSVEKMVSPIEFIEDRHNKGLMFEIIYE